MPPKSEDWLDKYTSLTLNSLIHTRTERWDDEFPFQTVEEITEFLAEFEEIVAEAVPEPALVLTNQATFRQAKTPWLRLGDFREAVVQGGDLSEMQQLFSATRPVAEGKGTDGFSATFYVFDGNVDLSVEGPRLTVVEGVRAAAAAAVNRYAEAKRQAEARAMAEAARQEAAALGPEGGSFSGPLLERGGSGSAHTRPWYENPWVVGIGVTVIGTVVAALIVALLS